ncbi:MAG: nicotinamide mononucleotide transporter [Saprospiraceae bacterium]|nr:nicotinamide mononucleotide transporter [Saprospiraceae bacterium]
MSNISNLDIMITVFSIIYLYFATQNKAICFLFGLIASAIWAYHDFVNLNLKFDGFLQLFYVAMSIWGLYSWKYGGKGKKELPISRMTAIDHVVSILGGIVVGAGIAWLTMNILETALPYLDAVTTALAIITTIMLVLRKLENWLYWIVIDLVYIYIFIRQGAPLLAGVMGLYGFLAIYGYIEWRRLINNTEA